MRVHLLGVRGSTPAVGAEFAGVGGNTSCVAVAHDGGRPVLVLDAGTGIRRLPALLGEAPFAGTVLLGHLHWDHTQGLPFCPAIDNADASVRLFLPAQDDDAAAVLGRAMSPPHFPIGPDGLRGAWTFESLEEGTHEVEGFEVLAREIPHKGGRTFGYRISDGRSAVAYLSDHGPSMLGLGPHGWGPYHPAAMDLARDVNLLIHDAQHTAAELPSRALFGHSSADYAVELGRRAGVQRVLLFHHDPNRTDAAVAAMVDSFAGAGIDVAGAREGDVHDLGAAIA